MALLPGYRYLEVGEVIPKNTKIDGVKGPEPTICQGMEAGWENFYMVPCSPIAKPRRVRSYMPTETSLQAHESQKDKAPNDGARILQFIAASTATGCTCDEVETLLQFSHQTASARIRDLSKGGFLVDSGLRRKTRTGRSATVWKASK